MTALLEYPNVFTLVAVLYFSIILCVIFVCGVFMLFLNCAIVLYFFCFCTYVVITVVLCLFVCLFVCLFLFSFSCTLLHGRTAMPNI